jgi:type I site-specific restriction-modification system R (restriction) subunit
VPEKARWDFLEKNAKKPEIGKLIDEAMDIIEKDNPTLKGVLPKNYARPGLNKQRLGELISDGIEARAGTITSTKERFMQWKTINGEKPRIGLTEIEVLLKGICNKKKLLDIIRNFIVFEKEKETQKKLAAYHQYWAVNKAIESKQAELIAKNWAEKK